MSLSDSFRSLAVCAVNMGDTVLFWKDKWNLGVLQLQFPQLFSFVRKENISVGRFLTQTAEQNFQVPLSIEASEQLQELADLI